MKLCKPKRILAIMSACIFIIIAGLGCAIPKDKDWPGALYLFALSVMLLLYAFQGREKKPRIKRGEK